MLRVLYSFKGGTDGAYPEAALLDVNGTLYGTTSGGGLKGCGIHGGCGTVFKISPSGAEHILYRFKNSPDGAFPEVNLIDVNGRLYGTTHQGGTYGAGTVFEITTSGEERVLYRFKGFRDGASPAAPLIDVGGDLYGTTAAGGERFGRCGKGGRLGGCGTVFKISTSGSETVLYRFANSGPDGEYPQAGLTNVRGTLYGTAAGGTYGVGTVFSVTTTGREEVVYSFNNSGDGGTYPTAGLLYLKGTLYGTTSSGGAVGAGTVFSLAP